MTLRFADKLVFGLLFAAGFLLLVSLVLFNFGSVLAFYLLSSTMIFSAAGVVLVRDVIRSAFLLALSFLCMGGLYVTLHADFLAAAQILIYAGAVSILFVFGIMLTRKGGKGFPEYSVDFKFFAFIFVFLGVLVLMGQAIFRGQWRIEGSTTPADINTVARIGELFFNQYIIPFEIASVILLMALIGAVVIAKKDEVSEESNYGG
jgi:NADH:ubiquinone oxidoreductase subunit 6 (subunit J)